MSLTDHSMCRCGSTRGSGLWGCAGQQVRAGSWEQWGHFLQPGCPGSVGREEGCCLDPRGTPESEGAGQHDWWLDTMHFKHIYAVTAITADVSNKIPFHLPVSGEGPFVLLCNLWWSLQPSTHPPDPGSRPEWTETKTIAFSSLCTEWER